ncbi:MAG: recombinase family protein [Dehalococcoidia bacterium]
MKAIGYFRVKAEHETKGMPPSVTEQKEGFFRFCQERGHQPVVTFVDVDSMDEIGNAQYQRMLGYIGREEEGFVVAVKALDQLNPDPQGAVRCLLELEDLGATVLCTDEELVDPLGTALRAWSTQKGEKGERVKKGMRLRVVKGKGLGKPPFGYRVGADKKLEIVPEEAATVVLIYQLYLQENMGFRLIARYLNERGVTTRKGGRWSIVGIGDILRNRAYLGTYSRLGIRVPESHPAIITSPLFRKVQEKLDAKPKAARYVPRSPFLLSGLVYCGSCGNRMIGVSRRESWIRRKDRGRSHGEYRYYQCQSRTNQSVCQYHTRRAEVLEGTVIATLGRPNSLEALERFAEQHPPQDRTLERPQLERRLATLERRFREYLDQAAKNIIPLERLRAMGGELAMERRTLEQRLALLDAEARGEIGEKERRVHLLERLREIRERWGAMTISARKALLQDVIDRIVVYDDRIETSLRV